MPDHKTTLPSKAVLMQQNDQHQTLTFDETVSLIQKQLTSKGQTLAGAIRERSLYFRVSLLGGCNLKCTFCHNEGAPTTGTIDRTICNAAIKEAFNLGFRRVQFTGGEPLLHPKVADFISDARGIFDNVGITTNGTRLNQKIDDLIEAGITRIHISLQSETLREAGKDRLWGTPVWLEKILELSSRGYFSLRLNLPVPSDEILSAQTFLSEIAPFGNDIEVFSILPSYSSDAYPLEQLHSIVRAENSRRQKQSLRGIVSIRGYRPPIGLRCGNCASFSLCREQSHSLRLGADHFLRPCLATRQWDIKVTLEDLHNQMREATLLALDYIW